MASPTPLQLLPQPGETPERADAARNRQLLLCAARTIIERQGIDALTMQAVADEAKVGKGTVFRRFQDRSGLLHALLDQDEAMFQQHLLTGEPPLGPGAEPVDRLVAFGHARLDFILRHGPLLRAAERSDCGAVEHPARSAQRLHLQVLLTSAGHDPSEAAYVGSALCAALDAPVVLNQIDRDGMTVDQIKRGWASLARAATTV